MQQQQQQQQQTRAAAAAVQAVQSSQRWFVRKQIAHKKRGGEGKVHLARKKIKMGSFWGLYYRVFDIDSCLL